MKSVMNYKLLLFAQCLLSFGLCELSSGGKEKLVSDFVVYYNNLPNQLYICDEGILRSAHQTEDNTYKIEIILKVTSVSNVEVTKSLTCSATVQNVQNDMRVIDDDVKCEDLHEDIATIEQPTRQAAVTEPTFERKPIQLDNEIQAKTAATSGEQFIAIPRERPSTPCVGCSTHVNPQADGVSDLANLGIRHLDKHEPTVRHSLDTILDVERQVQVVNGVRYILTLLINFNSCNETATEACTSSRACKISVLVKPWVKLPNGSKYRAILANNCTEEWQYGDNGEVLPEDSDNNRAHNQIDSHPSKDDVSNDSIKAIHSLDVQSLPNQEKTLTEEQVRNIEEQIIPKNQFQHVPPKTDNKEVNTVLPNSDVNIQHVVKEDSVRHISENSIPSLESAKLNSKPDHKSQDNINLSQDKKQAIDDMLHFFDFSGFKPNSEVNEAKPRIKRSYDYDLQVLSLAENYQDIKKRLENAKFVYTLAQEMIDYLNEMDMTVKNRVLKNVLNAEEEFENYQHFVYIQALVTIPCDKADCEPEDTIAKICNGVIDSTNKDKPQVLNTFCHKDHKEKSESGNEVPLNDPVLQNLVKMAIKKIESESSSKHATRLNKIISANTRQASGTVTKISIMIDYINCNKSVAYLLKKNCTVLEHLGSRICEVIAHERHWLKEKKISYTCTDVPVDVSMSKEKLINENKTIDDPKILEMLREALQQLEIQSNRNNKQKIVKINSVSSQIIAGFLTKIEFLVGYTTCNNEYVLNQPSKVCDLLPNERFRKCLAQFWDRSWIEDGRQMEVACDDDLKKMDNDLKKNNNDRAIEKPRNKRSPPYNEGETENNLNGPQYKNLVGGSMEHDPKEPKYIKLAEDSLKKYMATSGVSESQALLLVNVDKVTTQVVSGIKTKLNFTVSTKNHNDNITCYSEIWERPWINETDIQVTCNIEDQQHSRTKRHQLGGSKEQDPNDPKYKVLAERSLQKYTQNIGTTQTLKLIEIEKVTTQVVQGSLTKIDFVLAESENSQHIKCHSEIWERPWLNKEDINVTCQAINERGKRGVPGGAVVQNANDPKYLILAEESLQKYLGDTGNTHPHKLLRVKYVATQVVAGSKTMIDFDVSQLNSDKIISCNADIWEQPWVNKKEITVTCNSNDQTKQTDHVRVKKAVVGGKTEQNANDTAYFNLAEESLGKYMSDTGETNLKVSVVKEVYTQVVSGLKTYINFDVSQLNSDKVISCKADIWEQKWLNKKEINVQCNMNEENSRKKREIFHSKDQQHSRTKRHQLGGSKEQDPNDPKYKVLAERSLQKYTQNIGTTQTLKLIEIEKVTTQVVQGSLTKIDFVLAESENSQHIKCHSEIWERPWLNKEDINVTCQAINERGKRGVPGGAVVQNANDPKYLILAEESLQKYLGDTGNTHPHKLLRVKYVATQVVAGSKTMIDFDVSQLNSDKIISCNADIWEQPWVNKKEITVTCNSNDQTKQTDHVRVKKAVVGGKTEQNANDTAYFNLAEESLGKYMSDTGETNLKVSVVKEVYTQVVSGLKTYINFDVSQLNSDKVISCKADIWEQKWLNKKEINVQCNMNEENSRKKREIFHSKEKSKHTIKNGKKVQDPKDKQYHSLAEESLREYERLKKNGVNLKVTEVKHVVTQVDSGMIYIIDFTAIPTTCSGNIAEVDCTNDNKIIMYCHTKIWDQSWMQFKEIDISCYSDNESDDHNEYDNDDAEAKSNIDERSRPTGMLGAPEAKNVDTPKYKKLAEETLEVYLSKSNRKFIHKITKIHSVTEQVVEGIITNIEYSIAPTTCLRKEDKGSEYNCDIKQPQVDLRCAAEIWDRPWLNGKDVKVDCWHSIQKKKLKGTTNLRSKRQIPNDDDYVDDELKFYYANRAVQNVNEQSRGGHLHKLITIHAIQHSMQMRMSMVRMYIELAETFCLRHQDELDLKNCEEMDGLNHKLCLARLWPSPDDELVVRHISVICDDEDDFESISGLHVSDLLLMSIREYERNPNVIFKTVHQGEPHIIPSLDSKIPIVLNFLLATTNCTKNVNLTNSLFTCYIDMSISTKPCTSYIWLMPNGKSIKTMTVRCSPLTSRTKRSVSDAANTTTDDAQIQKLVTAALEKLEMQSLQRYKQRVLQINSYSTKITTGKVTTIDFDVGYTACLKYEWVENVTSCDFLEHLPRRHCVAQIWERLWLNNGRNIDVRCEDDETPLEAHIEFESAEMAMELARAALKHIEAKYPHPRKQKVVRIFSLEKQVIAGIHYRMKIEVGLTECMALSERSDCKLTEGLGINKFCRVNVWIRPWTDHPPNYRVSCDYQDGAATEIYRNIQAEHLFYEFITTYNPTYINNHMELRRRFDIFKANVRKIHELNIYEMGTARYGITRFADLTYEEFRSKYTGLKPSLRSNNDIPMSKARIPYSRIPESFDWRDYDAVTEVKDQGSCGSCWAFSVTGNIEGQWKMQSGQLVSLSEQELVDCDKKDNGCNGGLMENAYRAVEELGGLEAETDYPYEGEDEKCVYNKTLSKVQISGAVNISANETKMAMWLLHNGPISIGINANAMQFYMGGISHPWKMLCDPTNLDHGVLIVGYGTKDYPLFHKRLPYWTVKNSWGKSWGEKGYYRVYRGDNTCGVNKMASSAVI